MIGIDREMPDQCEFCPCAINKNRGDYGYIGVCVLQDKKAVNLYNPVRPKECPFIEIVDYRTNGSVKDE